LGNRQEGLSVSLQLWGKGQIPLEHHPSPGHLGSHQEVLLVNLQLWVRSQIHSAPQHRHLGQRHNLEAVEHLASFQR
jgi:hypothetical protein